MDSPGLVGYSAWTQDFHLWPTCRHVLGSSKRGEKVKGKPSFLWVCKEVAHMISSPIGRDLSCGHTSPQGKLGNVVCSWAVMFPAIHSRVLFLKRKRNEWILVNNLPLLQLLSFCLSVFFFLYRKHHCADYDWHLTGQSQWSLYRLRVFPYHSQRSVCSASEQKLAMHSLLHWDPRSFQVCLRHSRAGRKCVFPLKAITSFIQ